MAFSWTDEKLFLIFNVFSVQWKGCFYWYKGMFFSFSDRRSAQPTPNEVLSLSQSSSSLNVWSCWWVSGSRLIHWNDCRVPAEARLKGLSGLRKQARGKRSLIMHASGPYYCTGLLKLQWIWRHERTHSWAQVEHGRMSQILIPWHVGHSWSLGEQINYRAYNVWNPSISNSPISAMPSV